MNRSEPNIAINTTKQLTKNHTRNELRLRVYEERFLSK